MSEDATMTIGRTFRIFDTPQSLIHAGELLNQMASPTQGTPWMKTLCGQVIRANGEGNNTIWCEICEDAL